MPARIDGLDAIKGKNEWWFGNNEVHSTVHKVRLLEFVITSLC
jgi:hypothetical protein